MFSNLFSSSSPVCQLGLVLELAVKLEETSQVPARVTPNCHFAILTAISTNCLCSPDGGVTSNLI